MTTHRNNIALVCIDFINDMVTTGGKLTGKGYLEFVRKHDTLNKLRVLQDRFRAEKHLLIHVRIGFSDDYIEHPLNSPLFGKAKEFQALKMGEWGTEFAALCMPTDHEKVIVKKRVSAFYGTDLESTLRVQEIKTVYIVGVATDLAVEAAVRDAHDRDFTVVVVADCCAAANDDEHSKSLRTIQKIALVRELNEVRF